MELTVREQGTKWSYIAHLQRGIYLLCKKLLNFGRDKRPWQQESRTLFLSDDLHSGLPAEGRGVQLFHLYADRTVHSCKLQYPEYLQNQMHRRSMLRTEITHQDSFLFLKEVENLFP